MVAPLKTNTQQQNGYIVKNGTIRHMWYLQCRQAKQIKGHTIKSKRKRRRTIIIQTNSEIKTIHIKLPSCHKYIELLGTSDWHLEDRLCLENEIDTFIEYVLKRPNRFVIVNGDIFNVAIKNSKTGPYNQRMSLQEAKKLAKEKLSKIKHRILLIKPGNHEIRIEKEVDLDVMFDLACELGLEDKYVREAGVLAIEYKSNYLLLTLHMAMVADARSVQSK